MFEEHHDLPNVEYQLMGKYIYNLASIGATEEELKKLFLKGGKASLKDIAKIECKHTRWVTPTKSED